jgi:DNA-binding transcriptional ArsR family regulator
MNSDLMDLVAQHFRALSEPARLQILDALRDGERTVGELIEITGLGQANASKHLQILQTLGFTTRRKEGLHVYYGLADEGVLRLCEIMCDRLAAEARARSALLETG